MTICPKCGASFLQLHPTDDKLTPEELAEAWNDVCPKLGLSKVLDVKGDRRQKCLLRIKERPGIDFWKAVFAAIPKSRFLLGKNERNWRVDFDFLVANDGNAVKIAEGKYGV